MEYRAGYNLTGGDEKNDDQASTAQLLDARMSTLSPNLFVCCENPARTPTTRIRFNLQSNVWPPKLHKISSGWNTSQSATRPHHKNDSMHSVSCRNVPHQPVMWDMKKTYTRWDRCLLIRSASIPFVVSLRIWFQSYNLFWSWRFLRRNNKSGVYKIYHTLSDLVWIFQFSKLWFSYSLPFYQIFSYYNYSIY